MNPVNVCICGGGNLAHVTGGFLAARPDCRVTLLTRHPESWSSDRTLYISDGEKIHKGIFQAVISDPAVALNGADIVLLCLPGFAIAQMLQSIRPFLRPRQTVGSIVCSTGFFFMAQSILGEETRLFGFQRVPFIARLTRYGHSAALLGHKKSLNIGTKNISDADTLAAQLTVLFDTPVHTVDHYLKVSLTNSNPLLHPSRLFSLFHDPAKTFQHKPLFYEEWDMESSIRYIACDNEFQSLLQVLGIRGEDIPSVLSYYESSDVQSLTAKIQSIEAFKGIYAPVKQTPEGTFAPDFESRYFTEDIPFGLLLIKALAFREGVGTPHIDATIQWAQHVMDKQYLTDGKLIGKDIRQTVAVYV